MSLINAGDSQTFSYQNSVQSLDIVVDGLYKFDLYGARGGSYGSGGYGQGGHSIGYKVLKAGDKLYIATGGAGGSNSYAGYPGGWNGGGSASRSQDQNYSMNASGGGATHIALNSNRGVLAEYQSNLDEILIIAGGGGGGSWHTYYNRGGSGGAGGGLEAGASSGFYGSYAGGTQTTGYAFGQGCNNGNGAGGGGGLYGGQGGGYAAAGGGSGYIANVPEVTIRGTTYSPTTTNGGNTGNGSATVSLELKPYDLTLLYNADYGNASYSWNTDFTVATLQASPNTGFKFIGWYINDVQQSTSLTYTLTVNADVTIEARFNYQNSVTLSYDNALGSATYARNDSDPNNITLTATLNDDAQFKGWYLNSSLLSSNNPYSHTLTSSVTIEARFDKIWSIDDRVDGDGAIQYTRGTDKNDVTFSVIPDANRHFTKYEVNGAEYLETPISLHLVQDILITAFFEEDDKFHITASTNFEYGTVSISDNDVYAGTTVILKARPFPGYVFVEWENGGNANPRSIVVTENTTVVAVYQKLIDTNTNYPYRCFVKDQMHMTDPPKAFMVVNRMDIRTDLLTKATSSFEVLNMDLSVNEGDVLVVYDPKGNVLYNGVIDSFETKSTNTDENLFYEIRCSQMQSFYKGNWIYEKGETPLSGYDNSWYFEKYSKAASTYPVPTDFEGLTPVSTNTYNDNNISASMGIGDNYSAKCTTYVWASEPFSTTIIFYTDDNGSVTLNDQTLSTLTSCTATAVDMTFVKGANKLEVCYTEGTSSDGWYMYLNYQSFPVYNASKTYAVGDYASYGTALYKCNTAIATPEAWTSSHWTNITAQIKIVELGSRILGLNSTYDLSSTYLEKSIYNILCDYSAGKLVGSSYVDPQVAQRLSGITPEFVGSTAGVNLVSQDIGTIYEFEDFIYSLYDKYGIVFDFTINFSGNNYVNIKVPDYQPLSIGNNIYAIRNMAPITEIEDTNRLVIFDSQNQYRTTFVATQTDVVEQPDASVSRFDITNTEIVFSDDPVSDLVANYLPQTMYNHKIEFDLVLSNNIYDFNEFKLGGPLNIYYTDRDANDYYSSVLTGYELSKETNSNIFEVHFICGIVRKKLTQLLTLGKV